MEYNLNFYKNGEYDKQIKYLQEEGKEWPEHIRLYWIMQSQLKGNRTPEAVYTGLLMMQNMLFARTQEEMQAYHGMIVSNHVLQTGIRVMREVAEMSKDPNFLQKDWSEKYYVDPKIYDYCDTAVFPVIWPVAYGDTIVMLQNIKKWKDNGYRTVVLYPLNRPDLKQLFECCPWIDKVVDLTLLEAESNRNTSIGLIHSSGYLNVSVQEYIIRCILKLIPKAKIVKLRYLPFLFGMEDQIEEIGKRIWEERARLWVENKEELPKIVDFKNIVKKKQIAVHFREGKYGDSEARDINPNYSQDLISELKKEYPDYEIIRLGDSSMTLLANCRNASHEDLTVAEQIKIIQESELFIGSHSAPQILTPAVSDTPIICICYTAQETTDSMDENIPRVTYEPIGNQVKAIFYQNMFDKEKNKLIPTQNNPDRDKIEYPEISDIMKKVKEIL